MKQKKCVRCGGAFVYNEKTIPKNREAKFAIVCPFCGNEYILIVENGVIMEEKYGSPYFKNLRPRKIKGKPWMDLSKANNLEL